ncbi:hypothetical protein SLS56_009237 [Neofusicoccum ribis]|uniref:Uncharacterized protein n=1 Tax=Neofusicoccum ribis TaxID=45134 RepID=A0ABR3SHW6_9PEZI
MIPLLTRYAAAGASRSLPRTLPATRVLPGTIRKASTESNPQAKDLFARFAKLDPELYGILTVTLGAIGAFAYFFGKPQATPLQRASDCLPVLKSSLHKLTLCLHLPAGNPTSATDSRKVPAVQGSEPWRTEGTHGKYMYYPQGDTKNAPREAPSALNVVVLPEVNLPKELHEKYNKWGKPEWEL